MMSSDDLADGPTNDFKGTTLQINDCDSEIKLNRSDNEDVLFKSPNSENNQEGSVKRSALNENQSSALALTSAGLFSLQFTVSYFYGYNIYMLIT